MENSDQENNLQKYADDITTIKSILMRVEEKSLIEYWAFYSWGILFIIGSITHQVLINISSFTISDLLIRLWIPVLLIGSLLETIAWIKKMSRESLPLFSRVDIKFWLSALGNCIGAAFMIVILVKTGGINYIPIFIQLIFGMYMLIYAQISYIQLCFYAYFLIATAIALYITGISVNALFLASGLILGVTLITAGISMWRKEKSKNDR